MITVDGKQYKHWPAYWRTIFYPESYRRLSAHIRHVLATFKAPDRHTWEQENIADGHRWNTYLGELFEKEGFSVRVPPLRQAPKAKDANHYSDHGDVFVGAIRIECKAIAAEFTCVEDFPYDPMIVDRVQTVSRKEKASALPVYICNISRRTRQVIGFSVEETRHIWSVHGVLDRTRSQFGVGKRDHYYMPKASALDWPDLVERLKTEGGLK